MVRHHGLQVIFGQSIQARGIRNFDDMVDHRSYAWNKLTDQPRRVMSIGLRSRALGFSSGDLGMNRYLYNSTQKLMEETRSCSAEAA